ncbi:trypsin-like peptidase domain-containing protein [Pauljensenia sp. UMB1235]|uniref:S1C family serine protease n=1 Tax=unclassified Pauljensenia TaxID=2908895 RepID=UPI00254BA36B|nr:MULTISPECIES: trypsin-like peptidase domain-containing protein [unclassified Pauljensenia]MDK6400764.1 trypsin-like peptidase domain-containing protein [Pauljensenia sp. UMB9872]MDK7173227.1 trypsin-like peptidase domain-containing protein [Pauljensenia sp. UMB1235]
MSDSPNNGEQRALSSEPTKAETTPTAKPAPRVQTQASDAGASGTSESTPLSRWAGRPAQVSGSTTPTESFPTRPTESLPHARFARPASPAQQASATGSTPAQQQGSYGTGSAYSGVTSGGTYRSATSGQPYQPSSSQAYQGAGATQSAGFHQPNQPGSRSQGASYAGGNGPTTQTHAYPSPLSAPTNTPTAPVATQSPKRRGPSWLAMILGMMATVAVSLSGAFVMLNVGHGKASETDSSANTATSASTVQPVNASGEDPDWQAVAAAVQPAVVTISVQSSSSSGVGSGVIYNAQGDIVTNYHVVSGATGADATIQVTLSDGRLYNATVVGTDPTTDLAVIRLENAPSDLTVAAFGSSSDLAVGQEVMAVGAPLGLSNTATTGIISALNRPVEVSRSKEDSQELDPNDPFGQLPGFGGGQEENQARAQASTDTQITNAIQVDASINPGNSGGPLFDATGRVIGINSSIASNTSSDKAGSIGLGFAIPVDLVTSVADQLIATGTVDHAVLGVSVTTKAVAVDGSNVAGASVEELTRGGAAAQAGLQAGDVITAVDGEPVSSSKQLTGYIRRYRSGQEVTITYVRNGEKQDVTVTLGKAS